ncbi:MAG: hypothetical protein CL608_03810 [Anaerolineaceae bacterium]|nr:hypothetical protein [Anaerolineaceae bacterium]
MMMKRFCIVLLTLLLLWSTAVPLFAQEEPQPTGPVSGQITNLTPGGTIPAGLELMLHAWDRDFNEKLMIEGQATATGTFQFDDVLLNSDWLYAVMLTVDDVLYFSEPTSLPAGAPTLNLDVPIYDKTSSTAAVQVARQHVFFDAAQDGLLVGEIYILSNLGDRTVAGNNGEDTLLSPLQFNLPEAAQNVTFEGDEDGRYLLTPGGFVDTAPLRPGEGTGQVVVRYVLPYEDGMNYTLAPNWPNNGVNFLVPEGVGITLTGDGLTAEETRDMGDGRLVAVYNYGGIQPGETLSLTLKGELAVTAASPTVEIIEAPESAPISKNWAIGGMIAGLLLIGTAVWWYLRSGTEDEEEALMEPDSSFDELVLQIAQLDAAREQGNLDETMYWQQRDNLRQQAQAILAQAEAG